MNSQDKTIIQHNIENLKQHLKLNHSHLPNVKVFENIGEHSFVIKFVQFNDFDLHVILKVKQDFKLVNSNLKTSCKYQKYTDHKLKLFEEFLKCKLRELQVLGENALCTFFDKAWEYAEKTFQKMK